MAVDTLLYAIRCGSFDIGGSRSLFINAIFHTDLGKLKHDDFIMQQCFKPYADDLISAGFSVQKDIPSDEKSYDIVYILLPKNMVEAQYLIAKGAILLRDNGVMICAAGNKAGGGRINRLMQDFGFKNLQSEIKNKARAVWGNACDLNKEKIAKSYNDGCEQKIIGGKFISRAGVFGWNKIDKGSEILCAHLPDDLKGKGADFGCGYGYISDFILSHYSNIDYITCIDADSRAIDMCSKNISKYECQKEFIWSDLTKPQNSLKNLDFIVMNPPFHEGKKTDTTLGQGFITVAHRSLRLGGGLWMVANSHLPYEGILEGRFTTCRKLYEGQGFKVFFAQK